MTFSSFFCLRVAFPDRYRPPFQPLPVVRVSQPLWKIAVWFEMITVLIVCFHWVVPSSFWRKLRLSLFDSINDIEPFHVFSQWSTSWWIPLCWYVLRYGNAWATWRSTGFYLQTDILHPWGITWDFEAWSLLCCLDDANLQLCSSFFRKQTSNRCISVWDSLAEKYVIFLGFTSTRGFALTICWMVSYQLGKWKCQICQSKWNILRKRQGKDIEPTSGGQVVLFVWEVVWQFRW